MDERGLTQILRKMMDEFSRILWAFLFLGLALGRPAWAQEKSPVLLPGGNVFEPPLADPREPADGIVHRGDENHYDGSLGGTLDLVVWKPSDGSRWAWGGLGAAYLSIVDKSSKFLDQRVRLEGMDLWWGTYVSAGSGNFSGRLEYLYGTSHLGAYDYFLHHSPPTPYLRDGWQALGSYQISPSWRFYGGLGGWFSAVPSVPSLYAHLGSEIYSGYSRLGGGLFRLFLAGDLKLGAELGGVPDLSLEGGFQWKAGKDGFPALRLAVLYYNGDSPYGQLAGQRDDHWSFGFFVSP